MPDLELKVPVDYLFKLNIQLVLSGLLENVKVYLFVCLPACLPAGLYTYRYVVLSYIHTF